MTAGPQHESAVTHNDTWPWSPDERPHVTVHDTRAPASDPSGPSIPPAVWFFLLTAFGISWGAIFLRRAADEGLRLTTKFGPSIAGLIAAFRVGRMVGVRDITRRLLTVRVRIAWFALCLFLPVIISMGSLAIRSIFGSDVWRASEVNLMSGLGLYLSLLATRLFAGGGLGEELGWRGFMLPHLQARIGALHASIVIGLFHGAWHLPAYGIATLFLTVFTVSGAIVFP